MCVQDKKKSKVVISLIHECLTEHKQSMALTIDLMKMNS